MRGYIYGSALLEAQFIIALSFALFVCSVVITGINMFERDPLIALGLDRRNN